MTHTYREQILRFRFRLPCFARTPLVPRYWGRAGMQGVRGELLGFGLGMRVWGLGLHYLVLHVHLGSNVIGVAREGEEELCKRPILVPPHHLIAIPNMV